MTEFLLCLFPFAVVIAGIVLLGELMLGKQASVKAMLYAATQDGEQASESVRDLFFKGQKGTVTLTDDPEHVPVTETDDEPVLDYTASDMQAALTVGSIFGFYDATSNTYKIRNTSAGNRLSKLKLINTSAATSAVLTPGSVGSTNLSVTITDTNITQDLADTLGGWMNMSSAHIQYAYTVRVHEGHPLGGESHTEGQTPLPSMVTLGEKNPEPYTAYMVIQNDEARHEDHVSDGKQITFDGLTDLGSPIDMSLVQESYLMPANSAYWDRDEGYGVE